MCVHHPWISWISERWGVHLCVHHPGSHGASSGCCQACLCFLCQERGPLLRPSPIHAHIASVFKKGRARTTLSCHFKPLPHQLPVRLLLINQLCPQKRLGMCMCASMRGTFASLRRPGFGCLLSTLMHNLHRHVKRCADMRLDKWRRGSHRRCRAVGSAQD